MKKKLGALGWVVLKSRMSWRRWAGDADDAEELGEPDSYPCLATRHVNRYDEYVSTYLYAADVQVLAAAISKAQEV